jgi:hypothetical protein
VPVTDGAYEGCDLAAIRASWSTQYAPSRFRTGHYLETFFACLYYAVPRTGDGTARQERGLKHRADNETRVIPIPPVLFRRFRVHIRSFGTTPTGDLLDRRGGILQDSGYSEVWTEARKTALTPAQQRSPLAAPTACATPTSHCG